MFKNTNLIFEADLSLSIDWLFWIFERFSSDIDEFLQELENALTLNDGYPNVDFLKMPDLKHDLEMRSEVETNLVELEYKYKNISEHEYKNKIKNIESLNNQNEIEKEFLDECRESSWEISIMACELYVYLSGHNHDDFFRFAGQLDKGLLEQLGVVHSNYNDFTKYKLSSIAPKALLILKHMKTFDSIDRLGFDSDYNFQAWCVYFSELEKDIDSMLGH